MPTFAELADTDPTAWLHQARGWDELGAQLAVRAERFRTGAAARLDERWIGADAHTARARRDELHRRLATAAERMRSVSHALGRHAGTVMAAQQRMFAAVHGANPLTTQVTEDGLVVPSPALLASPLLAVLLPVHLADARRISSEIAAALQDAARSDAETVAALRELVPGGPGDAPEPAPDLPPDGSTPDAVHAWWTALSPSQRDRLVAEHPDRVGALDGVPAVDRDRANRIRLDAERVRLRRARMRLGGAGDDAGVARVDALLSGIDALDRRRGPDGSATLLLAFDTAGSGHAVVAAGDPDTAADVVTSVPGMGARLEAVGIDLARSDALAAAARTADPSVGVSSITWLGYDAPSDLPAAVGAEPARRGAATLARFQDGLRATGHQQAHLTVVGHSYGSLVAGRAAADDDLDTDELVFVGSPGVGTRRGVADLHVDPRHVWATLASHDVIGHLPGAWAFGTSAPLRPGRLLAHGLDPTDPAFGARVFASAPGSLGARPDDPDTPVDESSASAAHVQYWDPGSPSLQTLGRIVVARGDASVGAALPSATGDGVDGGATPPFEPP